MLTRRYIDRRAEKKAFFSPGSGRIFVEGVGLLAENQTDLAQAVCTTFAYEVEVLYLMPCRGKWQDSRGQYPGKADWEATGLDLLAYYRNHGATVGIQSSEFLVEIVPIGLWFPSYVEGMYMSDTIRAMIILKDLLTQHFQPIEVTKGKHDAYPVELLTTPARTGLDLLRRKLPYGIKYGDLPLDVEHIVMSEFGQARSELFHHGSDTIEHLYNYDGLWMYASCCRHMPVGRVIHDDVNRYLPYITGLYLVEVRIPMDWRHIGLLPERRGDKTTYPNKPGTVIRSWCGHRDLKLAMDYQWDILGIRERILWPDSQARGMKIGQDPLRHWMETLVKLRQEVASQYEEPIRSFLRDGFRSLLNQTIGRLRMSARTIDIYTRDFKEDPGEGAYLDPKEQFYDGSGIIHYLKKEELSSYQKELFQPHWTLEIWNQCKWKVTKAALEVPYEQLLGIRTDGLWTTGPTYFEDTGKPGCFREKQLAHTGPFNWPSNNLEFLSLIQGARNG